MGFFLKKIICLVTGVITFLLVSRLSSERVYFPANELGRLYRVWQHLADDLDAVFLGSSNTGLHVVAADFDRAVGGVSKGFRSFNFSFACAGSLDSFEMFRQFLHHKKSKRLKYVLLEATAANFSFRMTDCRGSHSNPEYADLTSIADMRLRAEFGLLDGGNRFSIATSFLKNLLGFNYLHRSLLPQPDDVKQVIANGGVMGVQLTEAGKGVELLPDLYYSGRMTPESRDIRVLGRIVDKLKMMGLIPVLIPGIAGDSPRIFNGIVAGAYPVATLNPFANEEMKKSLRDRHYFYDQLHLNSAGAKLYTHGLADLFVKYFEKRLAGGS